MAKRSVKKAKAKLVTKQVGIGVPYSTMASSYPGVTTNAPSTNVVATPVPIPTQPWPAPTQWYQQGKDATKKALTEISNNVVQIENETDNERRLSLTGKQNNLAQGLIQGIAIATEAMELELQRIRTGDQAAKFELALTEDTLKRMLKMLWCHNFLAKKGMYPGMEIKLLESQLTGRINRAASFRTNDDGMELEIAKGEKASDLFLMEYQPPDAGQQGAPLPTTQQTSPAPIGAAPPSLPGQVPQEQPPPAQAATPQAEQPAQQEQAAQAGELPITEEDIAKLLGPREGQQAESLGVPQMEASQREAALAQREASVAQREAAVAEREAAVNAREQALMGDFPDMEDEEEPGEMDTEEIPPENTEEEQIEPGEMETEEIPPENTEEEEIEEGETQYCPLCDMEVSQEDIDECQNPECPFKQPQEEPVEEEPAEEEVSKHYILMDHNDHEGHDTHTVLIKGYTDVKGEYCVTCNKFFSYSFGDTWNTSQVKSFIKKSLESKKVREKSAQDIIYSTLYDLPEDVICEWIEEKKQSALNEDELANFVAEETTKAFKEISP